MHNHPKERTAHGDVKLENILLFEDGHAKLCDLGAAESEDVSSTRGVMSMQYVSPERIDDAQGRASGSSDVWALGIVLHFLLFGKSPFRSEHAAGLIREIGSFKGSQIGTSCGKNELDLLKRMLDHDCVTRLTSKQLVESSILHCLINTTQAGWKLIEMKSRETEAKLAKLENQLSDEQKDRPKRISDLELKLRTSEAQVAELQTQLERMRMIMPTTWIGTESLQTLDRTAHRLTPTTLTQVIILNILSWRTAFTFRIDEGEWELKIRASENTFKNVVLGFLRHPLPEIATRHTCGYWKNGIGGDFGLRYGDMYQSNGEFKPAGTNKKCVRVGQTAAIRVNMRTREARLFVDDEEQPGIFTAIPSPLCLGITTQDQNTPIEVLWLKRLRS
ncbi:putative Protein kinase domain containing protein [Blattamonas nauphoetae]|uniref:Protein kinase domain-containing protein n=1 Tax=Blattamonas nauphoetae TaxID=2049346 RepID=A0ABQ9X9E8_9EUKA|nr:putative Protein kinase domain containing protein [Blattamonas nauphoetae]